jgi:6-phosphogluconolactonase (cycloisomerase 2 family)
MKHITSSILPVSLLLLLAVTGLCATAQAQTPADDSLSSAPSTITAQYLYALASSTSGNGLIAGFRIGRGGGLTFTGQAFPIRLASGGSIGFSFGFGTLVQSARGAKLFAAGGACVGAGLCSASIWTFAVAPTTGILQLASLLRIPTNQFPVTMAINPQSTLLFVLKRIDPGTSNDISRITTYRIAPSGALTPIASVRIAPTAGGLAVDPAGRFLYASTTTVNGPVTIAQFAVNATTGVLTFVRRFSDSNLSSFSDAHLAIHPSGRFLYASTTQGSFVLTFSINSVTGALSDLQLARCNCDLGPEFGGITVISPRGTVLFANTQNDPGISVYTINTSTGLLTPIPEAFTPFVPGQQAPFTVDGTGKFLYLVDADFSALHSISAFAVTDSGGLTQLVNSPFSLPSSIGEVRALRVVSVRR